MGCTEKSDFIVGRGITKNQYREGDCLKVGDWTVFRFRGNLARKRKVVFLRMGFGTPMHTRNDTEKILKGMFEFMLM